MKSTFLKSILAGGLALGACGLSMAQTVTFTGFANGSQAVKVDLPGSPLVESYTLAAGGFSTSVNGGPSFASYCVDLYQWLPGWNTANGTYGEVDAAIFFGSKLDDVAKLFSGVSGQVDSALESAAFQLALWEIKYESSGSGYNMLAGDVKFSDSYSNNGAVATAQTYLDGLSTYANNLQVHVLASNSNQDVVFATPVPEPSTYALMLIGLAGVAFAARRGKSKA
jgi:hypothetical protein